MSLVIDSDPGVLCPRERADPRITHSERYCDEGGRSVGQVRVRQAEENAQLFLPRAIRRFLTLCVTSRHAHRPSSALQTLRTSFAGLLYLLTEQLFDLLPS